MHRPEPMTGTLRSHCVLTSDTVRQNREDGFAPGALEPPDGETTQPEPDVLRVGISSIKMVGDPGARGVVPARRPVCSGR